MNNLCRLPCKKKKESNKQVMYQVLAWFMGRGQSLFLLYRVYMLNSVQLFSATHTDTLRHVSREPERPARICRLGRKRPWRLSGRSRRLTSRTALNYVPRSHVVAAEALRRHDADRRPRRSAVPPGSPAAAPSVQLF